MYIFFFCKFTWKKGLRLSANIMTAIEKDTMQTNRVGSMGPHILESSRIPSSENNSDAAGEFTSKVCIKFNAEFFMDHRWKADKFMHKAENSGRRTGRDLLYRCIYCHLSLHLATRLLDLDKVPALTSSLYGTKCSSLAARELAKRRERWHLVSISVKIAGSFAVRID